MYISDQSHIDRVREALWQRSSDASIMVGSGFSRNALKSRPDADAPPTWREVTKALSDKLYPQDDGSDVILGSSATGDFLKLAQEYEAAFGRGDLHRFIQKSIRDDDFKPGDLHTRLLRLPWRDVFTTNWDTLLERTFVTDRAYSVVRNREELSLVDQPRIIKLHGSLPSHFPLIFTEEDYRTYPRKFAPFVNTVQQAMMETVFCLIGFSGDDPNFLQWSGWVRDNLGESVPKIYLAGWLKLSPHRRRMLEDRNIVPIDLALHPKADKWPEHLRHQYATDWILHSLERGQPYEVTEWPSRSARQLPLIPEKLQPVKEVVPDEPKKEIDLAYGNDLSPINLSDQMRKCLKNWEHNRRIYPGWLTAPTSARHSMSWDTDKWESKILSVFSSDEWESRILSVFSKYEPVDRLKVIRELMWRREIMLDPISNELETAAQEVLEEIDCQDRTIKGIADTNVDWADIREIWCTVALTLVTVARFKFDEDLFEKRIEVLSPFRDDHIDISQRIHHERCLWAIYSLDFEKLEGLLKNWKTENCDPVWMMRKAAILVETNQSDDAIQLIKHALSAIRENPGDERSLAIPSREGWALCLALSFEKRDGKSSQNLIDSSLSSRRWRELAPLQCDATMEIHWYAEAIKGSNERKEKVPFDLDRRQGYHIHFSSGDDRHIAAYRAIRLSEVAGLPPKTKYFTVASGILKFAADKLAMTDLEMAVRLVLRVFDFDQDIVLTHVLSRPRVAAMPVDSVERLIQVCNNAIEYALPRIAGGRPHAIFWIERLRVALEVLSRLVLRSDPKMAETVFGKALEYYRNSHVAQDRFFEQPVLHIMERSWETLPKDRQTDRVFDLLSAPIVGMDGFTASSDSYPDPGWLIQDESPLPNRTSDNENRWQEIISLIVRGLSAGGEARKRASTRVVEIALKGRLLDDEASHVAQALWHQDYTKPEDLPGETNINEWVFLLLPEPKQGLAEQRFRRKWLDTDNSSQDVSLDEILWQVGSAISGLKDRQQPLTLSDKEKNYLADLVGQWAEYPPLPQIGIFPDNERIDLARRGIFGLRSILLEVPILDVTATKLYEKVQALQESNMPGLRLIAGIVKALPDRVDEIALLVRMELTSDNSDRAGNATWGLYDWLKAASDSTLGILPLACLSLVLSIYSA